MSNQSNVESMLIRLGIGDAYPQFRDMGVNRLVDLRKLSEEQLCAAVPDPDRRQALVLSIVSRGSVQDRRSGGPPGALHPPRNPDADLNRGGDLGEGRGGGHGRGGRGRGSGRGRGGRGNGAPMGDGEVRVCRHFFTEAGCKYGDSCRYSHSQEEYDRVGDLQPTGGVGNRTEGKIPATHNVSDEIVIPTDRLKFLMGSQGNTLFSINEVCDTYNERFSHADETSPTFTFLMYGTCIETVHRAKEMILVTCGVRKEEEKKSRFHYAVKELDANTDAARFLAACNAKNKGTPRCLSDSIMKSVISSFNFVKEQEVRHFYMNTSNSDKDRFEMVRKIVSQLKGVQAIIFCDQKRVQQMSDGAGRIATHFNGVVPHFLHREMTKEERMTALESFKKGVENENGVKERLLITNEDYAKLARKTVIPYVNLVISFTVPRTEEYYVLQSKVAGRQGTVGASLLCVNTYDEISFRELQKNIEFEHFTEEENFRATALELSYDTRAAPLTPENADPPADWREHLNDKKVRHVVDRRH